jgi:murein L,D-transpeptidase YafK
MLARSRALAGSKAALRRGAAALLLAALLPGGPAGADALKHLRPVPPETIALMGVRDVAPSAPILIRTFKLEAELEVWKQARDGRFVLLKTFPICRWSGQLGPKTREGDRQAPEGFYAVAAGQMNPNSKYYLSFDLGYPNAFDRAHGRTGSALMVHGTCSSAGCFAMTDAGVAEVYALARDALAGGQRAFQVQAYPFRMTARNMARHRADPNMPFWRQLKAGYDRFEATGREPAVLVAGGRYAFAPFKDERVEALAAARLAEEDARTAALVEEGVAAVRTTYADGGQHPAFARLLARGASLGEISRPEALAFAGREVVMIPGRPKPLPVPLPPERPGEIPVETQLAAAEPPAAGEPVAADAAPWEPWTPFAHRLLVARLPAAAPGAVPGAARILPATLGAPAATAAAPASFGPVLAAAVRP